MASTLTNLAVLRHEQGRHREAVFLYRRAWEIREKALGPDHPQVAASLENYAALLRAMDHPRMAAPLEARAEAIRAKLPQVQAAK